LQEFITDSDYYNQIAPTNATIDFCLRIDYVYDPADGSDESVINFHETNVTLAVDLTAGFSLTGIAVDRDAAEQASAAVSLQYPVAAYFCDEASVEVPTPIFSQGSVLQFCVELNENVTTTGVYVSDVLMVDLDQSSGGAQHADIITGSVPDWLTRKTCSAGICNIKTQLTSKWFAEIDPESMDITGTALLAFGSASRRRYLRVAFGTVPNDQDHDDDDQQQQRKLPETEALTDPLEDLLSEFGLTVDLEGPGDEGDNQLGMIIVCVAVSVAAIVLCQIVSCFCCKNKVITKTTTTNIYDHNNNEEVQSAPTFYPPPPLPNQYPRQPSPPALYSAPSSFRQSFAQDQKLSDPSLNYNSDSYDVTDSTPLSFRQSFAKNQKLSDPYLNDNSDSYDITDYPGFPVATKVAPMADGRLPLHAKKESCYDDEIIVVEESRYDDEIIVVAVPIATTTHKRHKSRKSSSQRRSGGDGLHRKSRKSSNRHGRSDGLNRSDHSQPENGIRPNPSSDKITRATCQFID
jgi:hypothetical protein